MTFRPGHDLNHKQAFLGISLGPLIGALNWRGNIYRRRYPAPPGQAQLVSLAPAKLKCSSLKVRCVKFFQEAQLTRVLLLSDRLPSLDSGMAAQKEQNPYCSKNDLI